MKSVKFITFILLNTMLAAACVKRAPQTSKNIELDGPFELRNTNAAVSIKDIQTAPQSVPMNNTKSSTARISGKDWLELSTELMNTPASLKSSDGQPLAQLGHDLSAAYYNFPATCTTIDASTSPAGNPVAELTYSIAKPAVAQKYVEVLNKTTASVERTLKKVKMQHMSPLTSLDYSITYLDNLTNQLNATKTADTQIAIDKITNDLSSRLIQGLKTLQRIVNKDQSASEFAGDLKAAISNLQVLPDEDKNSAVNQLQMVQNIATRVDSIKDKNDALAIVIDLWLGKENREQFPEALRKYLASKTDQQLVVLATHNLPQILEEGMFNRKKVEDLEKLTDFEIIAISTNNNVPTMSPSEWAPLAEEKQSVLLPLLTQPEVVEFIKRKEMNQRSTPETLAGIIVDWLNLRLRVSFPNELRAAAAQFSDKQLMKIKDGCSIGSLLKGQIKICGAHYVAVGKIDEFTIEGEPNLKGPEALKNYLQTQLVTATKNKLLYSLHPIAQQLPQKLRTEILKSLKVAKSETQDWSDDKVREMTRLYLSQWFFSNRPAITEQQARQNPLPFIELNNVLYGITKSDISPFNGSSSETSAATLGMGFINAMARLREIETYEKQDSNSRQVRAILFTQLSKLVTLMGYDDSARRPVSAFLVPVTRANSREIFNLRNYDANNTIFATPDQVYLQGNFRMSLETRKDPKISVVGQMTLLRGYAQMMAMLKPWKDTRFDQSLGKIRIQEDSSLNLFPKNELFKVPLGLGASILRNLPKRQLALLDDKDNVYLSSGNFEDVDSSAAALIGFDRLGPKTTVTIEDIAQSILGLTEFLKEIEDITQFDDKEVKEALVELDQKRPLLNKLLVGLSTFASKYLLAKDGSFYSAVNIKTKTIDKTVRLSDQILMQQALLALADYSGAELPRLQVLDNIFYLNKNLWNPNSGFYISSNRSDANSNIQLVDVVRSINNFERLKGHLESLANAKGEELNPVEVTSSLTSLQSFWIKRFFSPQMKSLPKAALVLSFK